MKMTETTKNILALYAKGMSTIDIANRLGVSRPWVYDCLERNGARSRKKSGTVVSGRGISRRMIIEVRKKTKPGSRIRVKSTKASLYGDDDMKRGSNPKTLVKVLSSANPYFCLVELPGGTRESILWIDMVGENLDRY